MTPIDKIATLINKLLTLSNDKGATEAEAMLAAEKAQQLMTEHNLSMANIEAAGGQSSNDGARLKEGMQHRASYRWQRDLMRSICALNFCHCTERYVEFRHTRTFDGYNLIGRAVNVATIRTMFEYLLQAIERLTRENAQDPAQYFTRAAHSFREGCAARVAERLTQRREQEVEEQAAKAREERARAQHPASAGSNSLTVYLGDYVQDEKDLNEDFRRGWRPGTTKQNRLEDEIETARYRAERQAKRDARRIALLRDRPDVDPEGDLFDWLLDGLSEDSYYRSREPSKPETEAQRRKRHEQEARERQRWNDRLNREYAKKDWSAYTKGQRAGDKVGLDKQVDRNARKEIT